MRTADIRPVVQRFTAGDAAVTTILDGAHVRAPLNPPFGMDLPDEALAEMGRANRLPWDRFENTYAPVLIEIGAEKILVDTGFGAGGRDGGAGYLAARLGQVGVAPEDITCVFITHVHPDHILGVWEGDALAFPNARHMIGRREFDGWHSGEAIPEQRQANREMFMKLIAPLRDRLTFLDNGDAIAPGVVAEAAFGHSIGHMMVRIDAGGPQVLIWGDVCNHYVYSMQSPDSPVGFDDDKDAAIATRRRVLDMVATDDLLVIGYHMPFPATGYVERRAGAYVWVPAAYQLWLPDGEGAG